MARISYLQIMALIHQSQIERSDEWLNRQKDSGEAFSQHWSLLLQQRNLEWVVQQECLGVMVRGG